MSAAVDEGAVVAEAEMAQALSDGEELADPEWDNEGELEERLKLWTILGSIPEDVHHLIYFMVCNFKSLYQAAICYASGLRPDRHSSVSFAVR